jgi:hypothetical protein
LRSQVSFISVSSRFSLSGAQFFGAAICGRPSSQRNADDDIIEIYLQEKGEEFVSNLKWGSWPSNRSAPRSPAELPISYIWPLPHVSSCAIDGAISIID